jgi:hypothetical protein
LSNRKISPDAIKQGDSRTLEHTQTDGRLRTFAAAENGDEKSLGITCLDKKRLPEYSIQAAIYKVIS